MSNDGERIGNGGSHRQFLSYLKNSSSGVKEYISTSLPRQWNIGNATGSKQASKKPSRRQKERRWVQDALNKVKSPRKTWNKRSPSMNSVTRTPSSPLNTTTEESINTASPQCRPAISTAPKLSLSQVQSGKSKVNPIESSPLKELVAMRSANVNIRTFETDIEFDAFDDIITRVRPSSEISWDVSTLSSTNETRSRINTEEVVLALDFSVASVDVNKVVPSSPVIKNMEVSEEEQTEETVDSAVDEAISQKSRDSEEIAIVAGSDGMNLDSDSPPPINRTSNRCIAPAAIKKGKSLGDAFDSFVQNVTKGQQWSPKVTSTQLTVPDPKAAEVVQPFILESQDKLNHEAINRRYILVKNPNEMSPKVTRKGKQRIATPGPRANELRMPLRQRHLNVMSDLVTNNDKQGKSAAKEVSCGEASRKNLYFAKLKQRRLRQRQDDSQNVTPNQAQTPQGKENAAIANPTFGAMRTTPEEVMLDMDRTNSAACQQHTPEVKWNVHIQGDSANMEVYLDNLALSTPMTRYKIINGMTLCGEIVRSLKICFSDVGVDGGTSAATTYYKEELHDIIETVRFRLSNLKQLHLSGFVASDLEYCVTALREHESIQQIFVCLENDSLTEETVRSLSQFKNLLEVTINVNESFSFAAILGSGSLKKLRIGCIEANKEFASFQLSDVHLLQFADELEEVNKNMEETGVVSSLLQSLDFGPRMSTDALQALLNALRRNQTIESFACAFNGSVFEADIIAAEITFLLGTNTKLRSLRNHEYESVSITSEDLILRGLQNTNTTIQEVKFFRESIAHSCRKKVLLARNSLMTVANTKSDGFIGERFGCSAIQTSPFGLFPSKEVEFMDEDDRGSNIRSSIPSGSVSSLVTYFNDVIGRATTGCSSEL